LNSYSLLALRTVSTDSHPRTDYGIYQKQCLYIILIFIAFEPNYTDFWTSAFLSLEVYNSFTGSFAPLDLRHPYFIEYHGLYLQAP